MARGGGSAIATPSSDLRRQSAHGPGIPAPSSPRRANPYIGTAARRDRARPGRTAAAVRSRTRPSGWSSDYVEGTILGGAIATAAARLGRPLILQVVGAGPALAHIEQLARAHGVTLESYPWLAPTQRNAVFWSAELLAMPSLWPEPWGLVGLEAACVGLPTVAFDAGGISDWLSSAETGELAPASPPTADHFADALVRALADPQHYARLACGAWRRAHEYSMESHLERLTAVLRQASEA